MNEIKPRKLRVSHEDMQHITERLDAYRKLGVPEWEIARVRSELIEAYGKEVKEDE